MQVISFTNVTDAGLESSPVANALAGLRANEARYYWNKYKVEYQVYSPAEQPKVVAWVEHILQAERGIKFAAPVLEVFIYDSPDLFWPALYYKDGLAVNVLYEKHGEKPKRAVGFKLSQGMEPPKELAAFKFARQKSKLAGEIRGSYFVIKGDYPLPPGQ